VAAFAGRRARWLLVLVLCSCVLAQDSPPDGSRYWLEEIASGFEWPVYVTNAGDGSGRLFVLEQTGRIWLLPADGGARRLFLDLGSVVSQERHEIQYSERGLLSMAFHPNFSTNGQFFVDYIDNAGLTVIRRFKVRPDTPDEGDPAGAEFIFTYSQPDRTHNGGQIAFGPKGYLYIGLGDGGSSGDPDNNAQNLDLLLGKLLRIDVDGGLPYSIPAGNPIYGTRPQLAPEIWAWGLRNPWRFSFDSLTGDLYIGDVGQDHWEEIDFQAAGSPGGQNYGWRILEGQHPSSGETVPDDTTLPVAEYSHEAGCAVAGGYVYRGQALPDLQGIYFYGDWCSGTIWAAYRDAADQWQSSVFMQTTGLSITSFGVDEAGELYVVDYTGRIMKLVAA
jgi:glucose/arabinose dehydrogenase